jgi:1,4-alpha-glucan branching enzyme
VHSGVQKLVADLNRVYREQPALYEREFDHATFEWVDANDGDASVLSFLRRGYNDVILVVGNFSPILRHGYRVGVPEGGFWRELLNSDAEIYGGSNQGNSGGLTAEPIPHHGRPFSLRLTLPPLGILYLKPT